MTDRGKLLLIAAVALKLLGRFFGVPALEMAATASLALILLALLYTRVASARLAARRHVHPLHLFHDARGAVEIEVANEGRLPTALLLVEDQVPTAVADPARFVIEPLRPHQIGVVSYELHGRQRGRYTIGPAKVHLRDPFGIATRAVRFGHTDHVVVYPPVWALPPVLPRVGRFGTALEGQNKPLSVSGEFASVREYVRGDDLRKVHWKSTARRAKLMVKQEESPQESQATVVCDLRRAAHSGSGPTSTFELAVAAAASGAYHLHDRGYKLRLLTAPVAATPPSTPWESVLERLAVVQPEPGTTLAPLWQQLSKGIGGEGLLLVVAPVPNAQELRDMVKGGRGFGSRVAVMVAGAPRRGGGADARAGAQAVAALRAAGWRVTLYRPGDTLAERWRELALHARQPTAAGSAVAR